MADRHFLTVPKLARAIRNKRPKTSKETAEELAWGFIRARMCGVDKLAAELTRPSKREAARYEQELRAAVRVACAGFAPAA
jgi:hypothetical protein